ncbi:NTP transferase domain-containing protein [Pirellulales bacterium]|nr:NTP transferase domain-containing protein [Pirellulales bacterium]
MTNALDLNSAAARYYAIVPAAGRSRRLGRPKLLLPYAEELLIDRVLKAWTESAADEVVVVVRESDKSLRAACQRWPVHVVCGDTDPPDMKASIQLALRFLMTRFAIRESDCCCTAPADLPDLSTPIIDRVISVNQDSSTLRAPRFGDRIGHPLIVPWKLVPQIFRLNAGEGLDQLFQYNPVTTIDFPASKRLLDVDTNFDYQSSVSSRSSG